MKLLDITVCDWLMHYLCTAVYGYHCMCLNVAFSREFVFLRDYDIRSVSRVQVSPKVAWYIFDQSQTHDIGNHQVMSTWQEKIAFHNHEIRYHHIRWLSMSWICHRTVLNLLGQCNVYPWHFHDKYSIVMTFIIAIAGSSPWS